MKERIGLIDGDIYIYLAASANEYECQWNTWLWTLHADLDATIAQFEDTLEGLKKEAKLDHLVIALSHEANFRKAVLPTYKHNRVDKRKPVCYQAMRDYVRETLTTVELPALEADDVLGILATGNPFADTIALGDDRIIVSVDKDMATIPGTFYNSKTGVTHIITEEEADRAHLLQTLTGDQTDGYSGCPGLGPVKALKLLEKEGYTWETVVGAYDKAGLSEEVALQNARCARILRADNYDVFKQEVKLWLP